MPALVQFSTSFSPFLPLHRHTNSSTKNFIKSAKPINYYTNSRAKPESLRKYRFWAAAWRDKLSFSGLGRGKNGIILSRGRRVVLVKSNNGLKGFRGGGGGGGRKIDGETVRVLGNLALAIFLTYLTMNGQLGWLLDAVVSIWSQLIAVLVPIVGIGALLWWTSRVIVHSNCPNCGNEFQVFKSLNDEVKLCPFCSQPFSVEGDKFVRDPVTFSNESTMFDQVFNEFSPRTKKGRKSSGSVVDVEAEIRDAD
ncbi:hypothetical protein STAS_31455 [Striga asiatica]|uniref:Uncharacterized protein n=1 Tax=Striga asiatica TaxID=4170 RepID=A0A5A7R859_STRAF|nr:hypothetical protein STAS_31455 [Striga asiatica]